MPNCYFASFSDWDAKAPPGNRYYALRGDGTVLQAFARDGQLTIWYIAPDTDAIMPTDTRLNGATKADALGV